MYKYECISRETSSRIFMFMFLCFTSKVDKQTKRAFSISFLPFVYFFAAFVQNQSHFGFFLGTHRFGLKFSCLLLTCCHFYKYLSSAVKTSRTNNTPFFDFSECSKTIDEKRVIQESIRYESYYCGEFIPPHNTTLELKLERVSSLGKNERKCYHHRIR